MESTSFRKDRMETVYTVTDLVHARVIKNHLRDHDVPCQLESDGALDTGVGVMVRESDAHEARIVLQYH